MNEFVKNTGGFRVHKWDHYFSIYEKYFSKFKNKDIRVLEIGVSGGGSLQMWKNYFGSNSVIVGIDIDTRCYQYADENIFIEMIDQNNKSDIDNIIEKYGNFDLIIDDGSHINGHVINSFNWLFPILNDGGLYLIEDTHTSYWHEYGGGFRTENTSVEHSKKLVDHLTSYHFNNNETVDKYYANSISGIYFHDSIIVFEKKIRKYEPFDVFYIDGEIERESAFRKQKEI